MSTVFGLGFKNPIAIFGGTLLLASTACTVHSSPPPPAPPPAEPQVVYVEETRAEPIAVVPARIERYPHTTYRGRAAYYVNGRWYYESRDRGWVVFRDEPRELARFRTGIYVESSVPRPSPVVVVYGSQADVVSAPPAGWDRSPRVRYRDGDAYHVNGRWYYRSSQYGWVALRDEPRELADWRRASTGPTRIDGYIVDRSDVPRDITRYPRTPYRGTYAYLVGGRWYVSTPESGWVVFREEPRELSRRRVELGNRR